MKVFISWSGDRSRKVADKLWTWIPSVIQTVKPWTSAKDIDPGVRWFSEIGEKLEGTNFGIICLTPENQDSPWILFEAGALAKTLDKAFVCPYLIDLEPADLKGPLVQFQAVKSEKDSTLKLLQGINRALDEEKRVAEDQLNKTFKFWWPELEATLHDLPRQKENQKSQRSEKDLLEEILELVREQARSMNYPETIRGERAERIVEFVRSGPQPTTAAATSVSPHIQISSARRPSAGTNPCYHFSETNKDDGKE